MQTIVHNMNNKILHRGPDSEGLFADNYCALGMRRLSIIDLQGGNQPIWNEDRTLVIVFNGELYNFKTLRAELREKGHTFTTCPDTEVVLHGFEEYGYAFFSKMEGMYAFAIYNTVNHRVVLARDRVGEKPLYYYKSDDRFLFGSELKSLISTELVPKEINREALSYYFQLTYIPAPFSILEKVYKLPAGAYMVVQPNKSVDIEYYWKLTVTADNQITDYETAKKTLRDALFSSVEQRMISDVPLGAFLSGGIDSTVIVGIMSKLSANPVETFTIGFKEKQFDESGLAQLVADKHHTHHHRLLLDWDEAKTELDRLLDNMDEPFADSSLVATYMVSKLTKNYVTVALTGDAGDELFAGYNKYLIGYYSQLYNRVPRIVRNGFIKPLAKLLPYKSEISRKFNKVLSVAEKDTYLQRKELMSLGFKQNEVQSLMKNNYASDMELLSNYYNEFNSAQEQTMAQYLDFKVVLEGDMLPKVDRASMLASLETRVPMLDSKVIETAYRMPPKFKINGKNRKIILKDTFEDLIPPQLLSAHKSGFAIPLASWLEGELKEQLYRYSSKELLEEQGIFDSEYIGSVIEQHMSKKQNRASELWTFYVFQRWYEKYISDSD